MMTRDESESRDENLLKESQKTKLRGGEGGYKKKRLKKWKEAVEKI